MSEPMAEVDVQDLGDTLFRVLPEDFENFVLLYQREGDTRTYVVSTLQPAALIQALRSELTALKKGTTRNHRRHIQSDTH